MTQQSLLPEVKTRVKSPIKKKRAKGEENLQLSVCKYIRTKFPNVIFNCDIASGMRMAIWMASRCKKMRSGRGYPDLFIAHSNKLYQAHAHSQGGYNGLFLELKQENVRLVNGGLAKSKHLDEQLAVLEKLKEQGYQCHVVCGYDEAIKAINDYLK